MGQAKVGAARPTDLRLGGADFTVTAWVRTTVGGVVLSLSSEGSVWGDTGKAFVIRNGRVAADLCNVGIWSGNTVVTDGAWHRVAWVYTNAERTLRFYVDGRPDGLATGAIAHPDTAGHIFRIGAAAPNITPPNGFVGDIDEVRVYDRALTEAMLTSCEGPQPVAHWPLDGDGQDASGAGRHGVLTDVTTAEGKIGTCLRFTGNGAVEIVDEFADLRARFQLVKPVGLRDAIADIVRRYGQRYPDGPRRLRDAERLVADYDSIVAGLEAGDPQAATRARRAIALQREALLDDPSLDFERILVVRRGLGSLGLPNNWDSNSILQQSGYDNELMALSDWKRAPRLSTLYVPPNRGFIGDLDLHWDGRRMLVSMPGANGRWQVHEITLSDQTPTVRQLDLITEPDVDNYDACYLPDGAIIFSSTAPFVGVPCVTGSSHVSNLYRAERDGRVRRLTFEQDHDWCPTVMDDGRVLYLRWEYADLPHYVSRILFTMNPDGTNQMAYYGSNSYWPNSMFYARPIPGSGTRFMAIVSGHHDTQRMGELILFDTALGTHEADGVVQRLPGCGQRVVPEILDGLVQRKWPKFLHPWPLDDKRCLVAAQLVAGGRWGLYLADTFDNLTLIHEVPGSALLEPTPLKPRRVPPVIADRTKPDTREATVTLTDIYSGPGLAGVPRGTVKGLRLFTYQFAYHGVGGHVHRVGLDGPWDVRRIMGTVPVYPDGSAHFTVPANTPIAVQPLDADGRALQLMRSWMTAMPGEKVSCAGCHEPTNMPSANRLTLANRRPPDRIRPWYGPTRGFSFRREVQPVLDAHCVRCHGAGGHTPDLRDAPTAQPGVFPPSYMALRRYVRGHTIESDMHLLTPGEFHASTTHLVRILEKGHHGVKLDREGWDRINTWIDLNTPAHGTWGEITGPDYVAHQRRRRMEMDRRYAGLEVDAEAPLSGTPYRPGQPITASMLVGHDTPSAQGPAAAPTPRAIGVVRVAMGGGATLEMVRIPSGRLNLREAGGQVRAVGADRPLLMGRFEVTNAQYRLFDRLHNSRLEVGDFLQFSVEERGFPVNEPDQPVCRVSREQALAFCRWLTKRTGRRFSLPSEEQWEYACRAGTRTPLWYGDLTSNFARYANLADATLHSVATYPPWSNPSGYVQPWRNAVPSVNDGHRVSAPVGSYAPNPWGLYDMHGNVAEWTQSTTTGSRRAIVRGGSWYDPPAWATSGHREAYPGWRRLFDVGFRVVCEAE